MAMNATKLRGSLELAIVREMGRHGFQAAAEYEFIKKLAAALAAATADAVLAHLSANARATGTDTAGDGHDLGIE